MRQLGAGHECRRGKRVDSVAGEADRLQVVREGAERAVRDAGDVVVGEVEVAESGQLAEGGRGDVGEPVPLQVQQLQARLHAYNTVSLKYHCKFYSYSTYKG
jgi:hypothetical protein